MVQLEQNKIYTYDEPFGKHSMAHTQKPIQYIITENNCWECISHTKDKDGYIKICRNKKYLRLHRYVYEQVKGKIKGTLIIMHICNNPSCFNPKHLVEGTHHQNMMYKYECGRHKTGTK